MNIHKNNFRNSFMKNNSTTKMFDLQKINRKKIIISIFILIFICLLIYVTICAVHYYNIECYEKKSFINYFFNYDSEVCIQKDEPPKPVMKLPSLEKKKKYFILLIKIILMNKANVNVNLMEDV